MLMPFEMTLFSPEGRGFYSTPVCFHMRNAVLGIVVFSFLLLVFFPSAYAAPVNPDTTQLIELKVEDVAGVTRLDWPVEGQIPLPRGQISDITKLRILTYNGSTYETIPAQFQTGSLHGDNSLNLVRYYFRANNLSANGSLFYYLYVGPATLTAEPIPFPLTATDLGNEIRLNTSNAQGQAIEIMLDELRFSLAKSVRVNGNYIWPINTTTRGFFMEDSTGVSYSSLNAPAAMSWVWDGPYTKVLKVEGALKNASGASSLTYTAYVQFHAGTSRVDVKGITFMNRGLRTMATNGNHWRFKEIKFQSDIGITGTKTLQTDFYSESNYSTESIQVIQDATSGKIDQQIIPTQNGADDATAGNAFDNIYHRVRKDGVQVSNAGGTPTSNPTSNSPLQPIPNTQGNGLLHLSAGGQQFTAAYYHFWETMPKSIRVSNSLFAYDLWPKQNAQNDFTHTQGLIHGVTNASNPTTYYDNAVLACTNSNNSACNLFYVPDSQSYVLEVGKGVVTRFGFIFDGASGMSALDFSKAYQIPLLALPPEWYWGSASPAGQLTSDFLPWYVETRNWSTQSNFSQSLKDAATYSDKWGRSMWDSTQVCTNASLSTGECYTLMERLARGGVGRGHTGRFPFLWTLYGEHQWGSDQPDADAYGLSEGAVISALRARDVRGITDFPLDQWIINNTWFWQNPSTDIINGGYRYQNGDYTLGTDSGASGGSSRRHNIFAGKLLHAAITGDWSEKDALLIATRRITGNYSGWVQVGSMAAGGENAHRAKDIMGLVYLYYLTGDASYLNTAKQVVLASKTFMDTCYAKFGTHWTTDVSYLGDVDCRLPNGDTYGGEQPFMAGYWMRALSEFNRAWKYHYQQNDPVIYPWSLTTMQEFANLVIMPHISSSTTFSMPKEIQVHRSTSPPSLAAATTACASRVQGFTSVGNIIPLSGGTQQAYLVECYAGTELFNVAYWIVGLAFLFEETGNANYQSALLDVIPDVILNSGATPTTLANKIPSWRHTDLGSADIKIAAPFTHEIHQGLSVLASPPSAMPSLSLIAPSSIPLNAAATITLTGANIPSSPQVQVGSALTLNPSSPSSASSVTFSLTAAQVNALGVGVHQVSVIAGSTQTNSVGLSITPASPIPSVQNLSPPIGTSFVQGNTVPLSALIVNSLSTELLTVTVEMQTPTQSSLSTVYSTQLTANNSGVPFVHNYLLPSNAATGMYNWRITATNASGTTISNIFSFNVALASSSSVSLQSMSPSLVNPLLVIPGSPIMITLSGSGFVSGTTVHVGALTIPSVSTSIISPTQLTFLLYANDLSNLGNGDHSVSVQNSNGVSNALVLSVSPAASSPPSIVAVGPANNVIVNPNSTLVFSATITDSSSSPAVDVSLLIQGPGQTTPIVMATEPFIASPSGSNYTYALFVPSAAVLGSYSWSLSVSNPSNNLSAITPPQTIVLQAASAPSTCGDNVCSATETCTSCNLDCACASPSPSNNSGGGGGGGGGSGGSSRPAINPFVPTSNNGGEGTDGNGSTPTETPTITTGNSVTDFFGGIGAALVGAVTNDSATDFSINILVGVAVVIVVVGIAAYFFGLL